jgi:L-threonylcarbamoyladenylate synthase
MTDRNTVILSDSPRGLRAAVALLHAGDQVAFPTETVYGLGADARSDRAVAGVFAAKGRPAHNPLIVHLPDLAAAESLAAFSPRARDLAQAFWPGPLTLVLPCRREAGLSELVTAGLGTVALRVPAHPLAQALLEAFGGPLAAPSANPSGRVSPTTAAHVLDGLRGRIAAVIDGGACPVGLESSIVGFAGDRPLLLRPGGIPADTLGRAIGMDLAAPPPNPANDDPAAITAPGQLASHYAPRAALRLDAAGPEPGEVWLGFGPGAGGDGGQGGLNLSPAGDLAEAAANLFAYLREIDSLATRVGAAGIAVAPVPDKGLGVAINDRLRRAATPRP